MTSVRSTLLEAAAAESAISAAATAASSSLERLRGTITQLKTDAKETLAAEFETQRSANDFHSQVRSVQRALQVVSTSLEEELGALKATNSKQWEQLRLHASFFSESEGVKAELERLRSELRSARTQLAAFQTGEHAPLAALVGDLQAEVAELREQLASAKQSAAQDTQHLQDELSSLRRWRGEVQPQLDAVARQNTQLRAQIIEYFEKYSVDATSTAEQGSKSAAAEGKGSPSSGVLGRTTW